MTSDQAAGVGSVDAPLTRDPTLSADHLLLVVSATFTTRHQMVIWSEIREK